MTKQSLSDLWRENRSKDAGIDLASILDGARIIAQSLNPKTEVSFAGVALANTDRKQINLSSKILDDAIAANGFPVPGDIVDVLLGLTVHEVGHTLFSDNKIQFTNKLQRRAKVGYGEEKQFTQLVNVFEDIYIDHLMTAYPGYKDYLQRERVWSLGKFNPDSVIKPLEAKCTQTDMLNAMIYLTLTDGNVPKNVNDENMGVLAKMATYATKMCTKKLSKASAIIHAWDSLKTLPAVLTDEDRGFGTPTVAPEKDELKPASEQAKDDKANDEDAQDKLEEAEKPENENKDKEEETKKSQDTDAEKPEDGEDEDKAESDEVETTDSIEEDTGEEVEDVEPNSQLNLASELDNMVDDSTSLPKDLAEDVSDAIIEKRSDLTELLSHLAKDSHYTIIAYIPKEDAERAAYARSKTASAEEKLRRILQDYRLRRTKDYRGLMSGRISTRRLHRVAYGDQRVFQRREKPEEIDMAVCLLMDLSGSVHMHRDLIEQITCAIADAFTKEKLEIIALGYSEDNGTVYIPRLYDKETARVNINLQKEWGMTPSYEGLAAATAQLLRLAGKKQKILFHFTDGQPNTGRQNLIPELLDDIRGKGIIDIHICMASSIRQVFRRIYGEDTTFINNVDDLPDVIDKELRKRLKI